MKQIYYLLAVLCALRWNIAFAAETEPNNTREQASTLALNGSTTGNTSTPAMLTGGR